MGGRLFQRRTRPQKPTKSAAASKINSGVSMARISASSPEKPGKGGRSFIWKFVGIMERLFFQPGRNNGLAMKKPNASVLIGV